MNNKNKGFTLIELLIAVAIIGILAAVAVPTYANYIAKGKITTAQTDLVSLSMRLGNRYQRVLSYPAATAADTAALQAKVSGWVPSSEAGDFVFSSTKATTSEYTIIATGQSGRINGCVVSLTHAGVKSITACGDFTGDWL